MTIRGERDGAVARLVIDRPRRRNALTPAMIGELARAIGAAEEDAACRCIVITGAGGNFCSGRDLDATAADRSLPSVIAHDDAYAAIFDRLLRLSKPSVAVVRGHAVAGGFTLAMACHFVVAEAGARFGALEMRGGFPAAINTAVLSRLAGPRRALELLLSAETFTAARLEAMGLITRLANDEADLDRAASELVAGLVALDPVAVKLTLETHRAAASMPASEALTLGKQLNALLAASGRIAEAAANFAARKPKPR